VTEFHGDRQPVGVIYLDDIGVSALPRPDADREQSQGLVRSTK